MKENRKKNDQKKESEQTPSSEKESSKHTEKTDPKKGQRSAWDSLSKTLENLSEELPPDDTTTEDERYHQAKERSDYYQKRYATNEDFSKEWNREDKKEEGWDIFLPEFLRRSRLFGGDERENMKSDEKQNEHSSNRGWFGETFFSRRFSEEMSGLPKEIAKEIAHTMFNHADRAKNEALKMIASEVRGFLNELDLREEFRQMMDGVSIDIQMKMRFSTDEKTGELHTHLQENPTINNDKISNQSDD